MTLEEAIKHAEEVVAEQEESKKRWNECKDRGTIGWSESDLVSVENHIEKCDKCAAEHRQLAKWLHKYQKIKEIYDKWNVDFGVEDHRAMNKIGAVLNGDDTGRGDC